MGNQQSERMELEERMIAEMAAAIQALQAPMAALGSQAGAAMQGLGQGVQQGQHTANQATASSRPADVQCPQSAQFKGNHEGPRVLGWVHQATTFLKAAGMDNSEAVVWHISKVFGRRCSSVVEALLCWGEEVASSDANTTGPPSADHSHSSLKVRDRSA